MILILVVLFAFFSCQRVGNTSTEISDTSKIALITKQIRKKPFDSKLYLKRAKLFWQHNQKDSAIRDAIIAARIDSLSDSVTFILSEYLIYSGKVKDAIQWLEKYINRKPDNVLNLTQLANCYFILKDYRKAKEYLDNVFLIDKNYSRAHFIKGMVLIETNQPKEAINAFQTVVNYEPENYEAYNMLGILHHELDDTLAASYYRAAIRLKPNEPQYYYNLAFYYQEQKQYEKALNLYNHIIRKINNKYENAFYGMGYIYAAYLNDYVKAINYFDTVIRINPNNVDAIYNMGYCYEKIKDFTRARSCYIKAKAIVPNFQKAIDGLNRIDEALK
ncbi:MAG: tetratricopeptide repeat protein [Bacteroidales bacterium]|nr:tetratricopeptide repeat protein [Bacteroidales bacterium]